MVKITDFCSDLIEKARVLFNSNELFNAWKEDSVVTSDNALSYKYTEEKQLENKNGQLKLLL